MINLFVRMTAFWLAVLTAVSVQAADRSAVFKPSSINFANPERGYYVGYSNNFASTVIDDVGYLRGEGVTLVYALIRLDAFRNADITQAYLDRIEQSFAHIRKSGLKVVVRVAYNYPANEFDYLNAKDAPLAVVKRHIAQLAPIIQRNRHLITVMQAGFIGAWGEGHTSSNRLDTNAGKTAVISELLAKMPGDLEIQWRYPADAIRWRDAKIPGYSRIGLHNDCFLSSPTDVGTYSETPSVRVTERAKAAAISKWRFYSGETCGAEPDAIRADCASILREGKQFHLSSVNRDYYERFIESWKNDGCYTTVARSQGYRLKLVSAKLDASNVFSVVIENEGWARPVSARPVYVFWRDASGKEQKTVLKWNSIRSLDAGSRLAFGVKLAAAGRDFCIAAPDDRAPLANDRRYALRFANSDDAAKSQKWDALKARFCFRM
jgi:hypothetical protein